MVVLKALAEGQRVQLPSTKASDKTENVREAVQLKH